MNYTKLYSGDWVRISSKTLDRLSEVQKMPPYRQGCRYRKYSMVPTYRYYRGQYESHQKAYYKACLTQLMGRKPEALQAGLVNVDARTSWVLEQE
ncbi:MAG: hypothetical protein LRZ84_14600 [Desertifilum sp.]|nr:hypothetical protein [Desertifilum sp.]